MKKLILLALALVILIPINSYAYITFIGVDPAVAAIGDIGALELDAPDVFASTQYPTTSNFVFNGTPYESFAEAGLLLDPFLGGPADKIAKVFSTLLDNSGILLSYETTNQSDPSFFQATDVLNAPILGKYDLIFTDSWLATDGYQIDGNTIMEAGHLYTLSQVPLPSAIFLLAPGLLALFGLRRRVAK